MKSLIRLLRLFDGTQESPRETSFKCPGIIVFLDEFELVWRARRDRRDSFLQGLRALLDDSKDGIFLCVGMATGMGVDLEMVEHTYPALFARLRGANMPALREVEGVVDALGYARAFYSTGR